MHTQTTTRTKQQSSAETNGKQKHNGKQHDEQEEFKEMFDDDGDENAIMLQYDQVKRLREGHPIKVYNWHSDEIVGYIVCDIQLPDKLRKEWRLPPALAMKPMENTEEEVMCEFPFRDKESKLLAHQNYGIWYIWRHDVSKISIGCMVDCATDNFDHAEAKAWKRLLKAGIKNIGQLSGISKAKLTMIPKFGLKQLMIVEKRLRKLERKLLMS